jgi:hypothetical protein
MADTSPFTIQIEGPGLTLKREVEEPLVLKILGVLLGPKVQAFGLTSNLAAHSTASPPPMVANVGESPGEYLSRSGAKTNPEKVTAFGLYLRAQGGGSFTAKEIRDLFVSAGEPVPKNLTRDIKAAVQARWIASHPDQNDTYYVASSGEAAAASGFTERSMQRRAARSRSTNGSTPELALTRRTSRNGGARSVLDELLTEDYFAEPRTYHDIIQSASERGHRLQRTDLTQPLLDLVQSRPPKLKRQKVTKAGVQRPVWAYRNSRPEGQS